MNGDEEFFDAVTGERTDGDRGPSGLRLSPWVVRTEEAGVTVPGPDSQRGRGVSFGPQVEQERAAGFPVFRGVAVSGNAHSSVHSCFSHSRFRQGLLPCVGKTLCTPDWKGRCRERVVGWRVLGASSQDSWGRALIPQVLLNDRLLVLCRL